MNASPVLLPGIPFELFWDLVPEHWEPVVGSASRESGVLIEAGPHSDLFVSPDDLTDITRFDRAKPKETASP